ncbi:2TM domain-containing protein [Flavobacterium silvaticum]|uniref:2TM domain-containing protein n=1 Tax=Flavobacterium silvaticum TaxID=1852020 RepID=A0A972FP21_9FLAO|nr:2TM domain-containing protein [Flavobacterium silvaticum]NMH29238.1 2TM domain-containing protein [Flavobacterium silvaticum]
MSTEGIETNRQLREARKKVREIRGFYIHLTAYCIVIPILILINVLTVPDFYWFPFSMIGWGCGLLFHGLQVFGYIRPDWEQRKMKQFMGSDYNGAYDTKSSYQSITETAQFARARKRVQALAGFYKHLGIYLIINGFNLASKYFRLDDGEAFFTFGNFSLAFFWGIGLAIHAMNTYGTAVLFGPDWEERKIRKFMNDRDKPETWE